MANVCLIMGASGTGKSTSIKTLDPKETVIFNVLKKRLPFKGSMAMYNTNAKNMFNVDSYDVIITYLQSLNQNAQHVKNVVIDDATYIMRKEYFKIAKQTGLTC